MWPGKSVVVSYKQSNNLISPLGFLVLAMLIFIVAVGVSRAQSNPPEIYFDETGHAVRAEFLEFFNSHGGLAIFGYPLTEAFTKNGQLFQYFQRARFELHPDNPAGFQVQLSLLGDLLNYDRPGVADPTTTNPRCHYFPETRHSVCNAFLDYFNKNGGLDVFGYPIGELDIDHDRPIQSFQRMRMEWYPEKPIGQRVQLTNFGTLAFEFFKEDPARRLPSAPLRVTKLNVRASVKLPVTSQSGAQTVYAVVTNQLNQPVEGATVTFVIDLPTGKVVIERLLTDAKGRASAGFPFNNVRVGDMISIEATAGFLNVTTSSRTSFLPWR